MPPQKGDLVVCLESGHIGMLVDLLSFNRLKIDFTGDIVILDYEDVLFLGSKNVAKVSASKRE